MKTFFVVISAWLVCGVAGGGLINAWFQADDYMWSTQKKCEQIARRNLGFSFSLGLLGGPVSLAVGVIVSGAAADGWSASMKNCAR